MPPADDDFDIYGEDDGFGSVKVEEVSAAPRPRVRRLALPLHAVLPSPPFPPSWSYVLSARSARGQARLTQRLCGVYRARTTSRCPRSSRKRAPP